MKSKIALSFAFIAFLISFFAFRSDDDPFTELLKKLDAYTTKYPQEKVYLQLDKPYYAVGDDIWFKAYVVNSKTLAPTDLSKIIYVDLINEEDSLQKEIKLPLSSGVTWGDFKLPNSLNEGNYRIRAYTNYMRNFGQEFFFDKTIKIGNGWSNKVFASTVYKIAADKIEADIHFEDKNEIPYINDDVSYQIQVDGKTVSRGKTKTSEKGNALLSFANNPNISKTGKILATITLAGKEKVLKSIPVTSTSNNVDVQFMPEGGTLIEDLPSRIAIKVLNSSGLGEEVTGKIIDNEGTELTAFTTALGMGSFFNKAEAGKTYMAKIKFKDGSEKDFKLPSAQKSGYVLSINNADTGKIKFKILLSKDLAQGEELKLVAQQGGTVYNVSKATADRQALISSISKSKLPSGIVQFTLFSGTNQPVAERLVFIKNQADLVDIKGSVKSAGRKEKSIISIDALNNGQGVAGNFSVSVTNATKVEPDEDNESNILSSLLLTSDLAGYVEKPNRYFIKDDAKTNEALDNLLLTQGYRRFIWKNVINGSVPNITYLPEQSASISGTIVKGNKPVANAKVMLISSSKDGYVQKDTITNADGRFNFDELMFKDSTKFVVQARTKDDKKNVEVKLDVKSNQIVTKNKNSADIDVNVNSTLIKYIKANDSYLNEMTRLGIIEKGIKLKDVTISQKRMKQFENSANLMGPGNADATLTADQIPVGAKLSTLTAMKGGLKLGANGKLFVPRYYPAPMAIFFNGTFIEGMSIDDINPGDIETIEVLKSVGKTTIYGPRGGAGIILVTTKRGVGNNAFKGLPTLDIMNIAPKGFYVSRSFYIPQYNSPSANIKNDYRSTIYWNPQIITDEEGKAGFDFYNAEEASTYRVVIEGMDAEGHLARKVFTYDVK